MISILVAPVLLHVLNNRKTHSNRAQYGILSFAKSKVSSRDFAGPFHLFRINSLLQSTVFNFQRCRYVLIALDSRQLHCQCTSVYSLATSEQELLQGFRGSVESIKNLISGTKIYMQRRLHCLS